MQKLLSGPVEHGSEGRRRTRITENAIGADHASPSFAPDPGIGVGESFTFSQICGDQHVGDTGSTKKGSGAERFVDPADPRRAHTTELDGERHPVRAALVKTGDLDQDRQAPAQRIRSSPACASPSRIADPAELLLVVGVLRLPRAQLRRTIGFSSSMPSRRRARRGSVDSARLLIVTVIAMIAQPELPEETVRAA